MLWRSKKGEQRSLITEWHDGKTWNEMTEDEHQLSHGDYEAQSGIGVVPAHSREHLTPGDTAVIMLRRRLEEAVDDVAAGRDPVRVSFDPDAPPLETVACALRPMDGTALSRSSGSGALTSETIATEKKHQDA
jgi:hypothetical protein